MFERQQQLEGYTPPENVQNGHISGTAMTAGELTDFFENGTIIEMVKTRFGQNGRYTTGPVGGIASCLLVDHPEAHR